MIVDHTDLLYRLLEMEVPEILNGVVVIKAVAREIGFRSKVAVTTNQEGVDPVGACVGPRGARIQNIVTKLRGEKVDVVRWFEDPTQFIAHALSPAQPLRVQLDNEERTAVVIVPDQQLSLAIGKEGQNARLAAKLTEWKVDIKGSSELGNEPIDQAVEQETTEMAQIQTSEAQGIAQETRAHVVEPTTKASENTLDEFAENLKQDVLALAEVEDDEQMLSDSFTQIVFDMLSEAGEFEDPMVCYHRSTGMEVSGYAVDEDEGRLDLFLSIHTNVTPPETVTKQRVGTAFRRLRSFLDWCLKGRYVDLEESSPVFDMALHIYQVRNDLTQVRLCVVTDGRTTVETLPQDILGDLNITMSLWDIVRLHRLSTSGRERGAISVDFEQRFGKPIPCLQAESRQQGYRAFLTLLPGSVLRDIYADFGARLLERNVRSFLQARGKVNRGIRDTIAKEPTRFLAYNNGITLTGDAVHLTGDGTALAISRIDGLQIVNGGQTTASLLATNRGRADLSEVFVATKLIEIGSADRDELVRKVSRYANTQNRITEADLSANDPFHVRLEELSRTTWAPAVGGVQRQTKWFYERARGQYQDARASQLTPARRKAFSTEYPPQQRFSKTDLAKFENTWDQLPHIVSRGAQKNFSDYMIRLGGRDQLTVDRSYFERLIGKAILFRTAERIVQRQEFGGYRANIVTYTIALLSHATSQRINLEKIWRDQALGQTIQEAIAGVSHEVYRIITNPPSARNITEWCKSEKCWDVVRTGASREAVGLIRDELLGADAVKRENKRSLSEYSASYVENLKRVVEVSSEVWRMLMEWGAETNALDPSQRQLALNISKALRSGKNVSAEDAERAVVILDRAAELGFEPVAP